MENDAIIQFVCFITNLEPGEFVPIWEHYAKRNRNKKIEPALQEKLAKTKSKFKYISQHGSNGGDFCFTFIKDRISEYFPDHNVKVFHAGGYMPVQLLKKKKRQIDEEVRLVACFNHHEADFDFYFRLPLHHHLNIYQAYYENCIYSFILEFFVPEKDAEELEYKLKQKAPVETGIYKECLVMRA